MTDKQRIKELESDIKLLRDKLELYEKNPYKMTYVAIYRQIAAWVKEMYEEPLKLRSVGDDDIKGFDKSLKFTSELPDLLKLLDSLREKMTVEERKEADSLSTEFASVEQFIDGGIQNS